MCTNEVLFQRPVSHLTVRTKKVNLWGQNKWDNDLGCFLIIWKSRSLPIPSSPNPGETKTIASSTPRDHCRTHRRWNPILHFWGKSLWSSPSLDYTLRLCYVGRGVKGEGWRASRKRNGGLHDINTQGQVDICSSRSCNLFMFLWFFFFFMPRFLPNFVWFCCYLKNQVNTILYSM